MAGVNEDNFLWIVIYHTAPTCHLQAWPLCTVTGTVGNFLRCSCQSKPSSGYYRRKSKAVEKRSIPLLPVLLLSCVLHIRCGSLLGLQVTMTYLYARLAGGLPSCLRKMRFLTGLFLLSFPCTSTIPAVVIQESLFMLSICSLLLFLGFACMKILFLPERVICCIFDMAPINSVSSTGVTFFFFLRVI